MNIFFIGNDQQEFALALFGDEDKYSVVETSRIREKYYVVNQTVHVLWGMGKSATPFGAKLILCGNCFLNLLTKCTYKLIFVERSGFLTGVQGIVWRILVGKFWRSFFSSPSNWGNYMFLIFFFFPVSMRNFYSLLTFIEYIIILPLLSFSYAYFCKKERFCQVKK